MFQRPKFRTIMLLYCYTFTRLDRLILIEFCCWPSDLMSIMQQGTLLPRESWRRPVVGPNPCTYPFDLQAAMAPSFSRIALSTQLTSQRSLASRLLSSSSHWAWKKDGHLTHRYGVAVHVLPQHKVYWKEIIREPISPNFFNHQSHLQYPSSQPPLQ